MTACARVLVTALFCALGCATAAQGQELFIRTPRSGEIGGSFRGRWTGRGTETASLERQYRQWLSLPIRGSLLHPRVFSYTLALRPSFSQNTAHGLPSALRSRELGLDMSARLLGGYPLSITVSANRSNGTTGGGFGSEGDFSAAHLGSVLELRNRYVPLRVAYSSRTSENTWLPGPEFQPTAWSTRSRTWTFAAKTATITAQADHLDFDDRVGNGDFAVWNVSLSHQLRWGFGSRLESRYRRSDRSGDDSYLRTAWTEQLHIQHTRATASDLRFHHQGSETNGRRSESRGLVFNLNSRVARWLTVGARASTRSSTFGDNRERVLAAAPRVSTQFPLPLRMRLTAGGSVGVERRTRERVEGTLLDVLNEPHPIDDTRSFFLSETGIDASSITVRNADETIVYARDLDYQIVILDGVVEIVVLPGSRIGVGDQVLVSYRFTPTSPPPGDLLIANYSLVLSGRGLTLRHGRSIRDHGGGDEPAAGLTTFDENRTSLSARLPTPLGRWDLSASRTARASATQDYTTYELNTSLALPQLAGIQPNLGAAGRHSRQRDQVLTSRSAYLSGAWSAPSAVWIRGRVQILEINLEQGSTDRSLGGDLDASFRIADIEALVQIAVNRRSLPTEVTRTRLAVRLVRRF